jgi:hypothetical protein
MRLLYTLSVIAIVAVVGCKSKAEEKAEDVWINTYNQHIEQVTKILADGGLISQSQSLKKGTESLIQKFRESMIGVSIDPQIVREGRTDAQLDILRRMENDAINYWLVSPKTIKGHGIGKIVTRYNSFPKIGENRWVAIPDDKGREACGKAAAYITNTMLPALQPEWKPMNEKRWNQHKFSYGEPPFSVPVAGQEEKK